MSDSGVGGTVVWARRVDEEQSGREWRRFGLWYALPAGVIALVALLFGGFGALLGVLILLGGIGGMIAFWIWLTQRNRRTNPDIRLIDQRLVHGSGSVHLSDIEAWSSRYASGGGGSISSGSPASIVFRIPVMRDGARGVRPDGGPAYEVVHFFFPGMHGHELDEAAHALQQWIPAPYVDIEGLRY